MSVTILPISVVKMIISCIIILIILKLILVFNKDLSKPLPELPYKPAAKTPVQTTSNDSSKGEQICRQVLENLFDRPFKKSRPDFLKNPINNKYNLELDCYDPSLKLAVEYNGKQHYQYTPYFHKSIEAFQNQQYRDELKKRLCAENGVKLIEVPYNVQHADIPAYILDQIDKWIQRI